MSYRSQVEIVLYVKNIIVRPCQVQWEESQLEKIRSCQQPASTQPRQTHLRR